MTYQKRKKSSHNTENYFFSKIEIKPSKSIYIYIYTHTQ